MQVIRFVVILVTFILVAHENGIITLTDENALPFPVVIVIVKCGCGVDEAFLSLAMVL